MARSVKTDTPVRGGAEARKPMRPPVRRTLANQAYDAIHECILEGRFQTGERLGESQIASELEMSRAPVREALCRLVEDGLLVERPHRGVFVRKFDADEIVDIYNVRVALEVAAIRLFVRGNSSVVELEGAFSAMEGAAKRGDFRALIGRELEFHEAICRGASNSLLLAIFRSLEGKIRTTISLDDALMVAHAGVDLIAVAHEHTPIIEAVDSGDEMGAAHVLRDHLTWTVGSVLERLGGHSHVLLR